jgi:hypothetical protein
MKRWITFFLPLFITPSLYAVGGDVGVIPSLRIRVTEPDFNPDGRVNTLRFNEGTVTINGSTAIVTNAGGGGSITLPLPEGATNYVQVRDSLQAGATMYIASGTIGTPTGGAFYAVVGGSQLFKVDRDSSAFQFVTKTLYTNVGSVTITDAPLYISGSSIVVIGGQSGITVATVTWLNGRTSTDSVVSWTNGILNMPSGFSDGTDDGGGAVENSTHAPTWTMAGPVELSTTSFCASGLCFKSLSYTSTMNVIAVQGFNSAPSTNAHVAFRIAVSSGPSSTQWAYRTGEFHVSTNTALGVAISTSFPIYPNERFAVHVTSVSSIMIPRVKDAGVSMYYWKQPERNAWP